jgi:hypothetical protein
VIHNCSTLLGRRTALRRGKAKNSDVMSIATSKVGKASSASPSHSLDVTIPG